ncbi:MAG: hypothetical protein Q9184_005776, partial [Pyrenodesmia sp. 2 TL-2023]
LRFLSDVSHSPKEILALIDELNDLRNVLTAIGLVTQQRRDYSLDNLLSPLFSQVDRIIHELCELCGACPQKLKADDDYGEQLKFRLLARCKWTLAKGRVIELLHTFAALRPAPSPLLCHGLDSLEHANSNHHNDGSLDIFHLREELKKVSAQLSHSTPTEDHYQPEDPPAYQAASMIISSQTKSKALDLEAQSEGTTLIKRNPSLQIQRIRSHIPRSGPCKRTCSCACHSVYRVKTPTLLQYLVGSLLVKHNGLYGMNQACNERSCRRSNNASLRISYRFPDWLLNRVVSSVILSNRIDGPQLSLVVPRIVPDTSDIFALCVAGNINAVAKLLGSGLASPCDVRASWGYTPVQIAIDRGHWDLCHFLLKAGARMEITDLEENSVPDLAWNKICLKRVTDQDAVELENMFKKDDWFEEKQFTLLHKIVLGLRSPQRDLEEELSASTRDIDTPDSENRTPLSWAAELGNLSAVQTLLQHGTNMFSKSINGNTPLHYATKAPGSDCLNTLLKHGAPVNAKNKWKQSPLSFASYFQNDESFINPLLDRGADINERDCYGSTALINAVFMNHCRTARCLLERGAVSGTNELNVMNDAIENNSHAWISLLLEYKANISTANADGETSLHVLGRRGDHCSVQLLQSAQLDGLDPEARTNEGRTAWDVMEQRFDVTNEVKSAFHDLIAKLRPEGAYPTYSDTPEKVPLAVAEKLPDLVEVKVVEVPKDSV